MGATIELKLLSPRTIEVLRIQAFTGWSTYPVTITGARGEPIDGYKGLQVLGRCGRLSSEPLRHDIRISPGGRAYRATIGLRFEPESWDGSDFFMPEDETAYVFVTQRVVDALALHHISGLIAQPMSEYEWFGSSWDWI